MPASSFENSHSQIEVKSFQSGEAISREDRANNNEFVTITSRPE